MAPKNNRGGHLALARIKSRERVQLAMRIGSAFTTLTKTSGWVACTYFLYKTVSSLAGKNTHAIFLAALGMHADRWIAYAVATICTGGYFWEKRRNGALVKRFASLAAAEERKVDPRRSSSQLTQTGETNQEDRDDA